MLCSKWFCCKNGIFIIEKKQYCFNHMIKKCSTYKNNNKILYDEIIKMHYSIHNTI